MLLVLFMPEGIVGTIQRGERTVLGRLIRRLRYGDPDRATPRTPVNTVSENQG